MKGLKLIVILSLFFIAPLIQAANPLDVVINEIAWMGTEDGWYYEWIELYNNKEEKIDISGWKIENAGEKNKGLEISSGEILPKSFFLICKKEVKNCDFITWSLSLANEYKENGKLILRDNLNNLIDQTPESESKKWPAGNNTTPKKTMERKNPQLEGFNPDNWQTSQNSGGTPKTENSTAVKTKPQPIEEPVTETEPESESQPQPTEKPQPEPELIPKEKPITYPLGVFINELLPSPEGPDETEEWIEIFNQNNFEVDLSGWQISDTTGSINTYTFPERTIISSQGFLVFSRPTTKITLNNSGDGLNLVQPDGKIIDSVTYEKTPRGQSYNRIDSKWDWSTTLTPGSVNIIPTPISEAKEAKPSKEETKETIPEKELKEESKKELAAIGEQIPKEPSSFLPLLIALSFAIFSGIIILVLKKKIKTSYNKNI